MANCCHTDDLVEYTVAPMLVAPCYTSKYCEEPPMCCPVLPRCPKGYVYCCEKPTPKTPRPMPIECYEYDQCCEPQYKYHHPRQPSPQPRSRAPRSPPAQAPKPCEAEHCPTCSQPICKPIKTKYVMPCYRYEDGRIVNQPTGLMRRACEAAVRVQKKPFVVSTASANQAGEVRKHYCEDDRIIQPQPMKLVSRVCETPRIRKKPFVVSSFSADRSSEVRRYHSEDDRGNCCYHFERKKVCCPRKHVCGSFASCPHLDSDYPCRHGHVHGRPCTGPGCEYVDCDHAKVVDQPKHCCYYHV